MNINKLGNEAKKATKWSILTQIGTKLISPITNMVLARILTPEIFGIVTTVTMVTTFADMFTDAGFQQYLIQHNFKDKVQMNKYINVAFLTNLMLSLFIWATITIFNEQIASKLGNSGLGYVIVIACIQLPITSFSSIQIALFRRELNFKSLFHAQIIGAFVPLITTLPLAVLGAGFWSLIVGNICGELVRAIILTNKSSWKPNLYYNFDMLKKMFSFSFWALLEALSLWLVSWVDSFLIVSALSQYYLGLYKNSLSMVNAFLVIITGTITPIMFSTLSRLQHQKTEFRLFFYKAHRLISLVILPIGVGLFLYRDLVTLIILGPKWSEASMIVGISALTLAIRVVTVSIYSDVYRAIGKPIICLIFQTVDLFIIIGTCLISLKYGFWQFIFARALIRFDLIIPELIIAKKSVGIKIKYVIKNLLIPSFYCIAMISVSFILKCIGTGVIWSIFSIGLCMFVYIALLFIFSKNDFYLIFSLIKSKK